MISQEILNHNIEMNKVKAEKIKNELYLNQKFN